MNGVRMIHLCSLRTCGQSAKWHGLVFHEGSWGYGLFACEEDRPGMMVAMDAPGITKVIHEVTEACGSEARVYDQEHNMCHLTNIEVKGRLIQEVKLN